MWKFGMLQQAWTFVWAGGKWSSWASAGVGGGRGGVAEGRRWWAGGTGKVLRKIC